MTTSFSGRWQWGAAALLLAATVGCGLDHQDIPPLSGPSTNANAFTLAASPTQLPRDGQSQATVTLRATDVNGSPLVGQRYTVSVTPTEAVLSIREVITDASGRASFTVRAPSSTSTAASISVTATAVGGFGDTNSQILTITLDTEPTTVLDARFTVTPANPVAGQAATFNASSSTAANRTVIVRYTWSFGDGTSEETTTPTISHTYSEARSYAVTLTVTDNLDQTSTVGRQVIVVN